MKKYLMLLILALLHACQSESSNDYANTAGMEMQSEAYQDEEGDDQVDIKERKIIKTANTRFQVNSLEESTQRINQITEKFSGFISNTNQTNSNYSISNNITVKIPAEQLDQFLQEIEEESIFTHYLNIDAQDVTEEFVDISGRLETKKAVRDRYIDILRNKAQTVEDILNAEDKIRVIQEEIESIEGRLKYLNNRTSLSTVHIEMYQEVEYVKSPKAYKKSFASKIGDGFLAGWELIQNLAIGLVTIWPIVLILIGVFIGRRRLRKFFARKK